jgi:hypothetical protein
MMEHSWATSPGSLNTARINFRRSWNTNSRTSFWWYLFQDLHLLSQAATEEWTWSRSTINKNNNGKLIWQNI